MTWEQLAATFKLGRLVAQDGWTYQFTWNDVRWGSRFLIGEGESFAHTEDAWILLWSNANRLYQKHGNDYAQAAIDYSIALHGDVAERPRRARIQNLEPGDIPPGAMSRIKSFFEGRVAPGRAVGIVHSDQCSTASRAEPPDIGPLNGECYWKSDKTRSWGPNTVTAVSSDGSIASSSGETSILPWVVASGAVLGLAYLIFKDK